MSYPSTWIKVKFGEIAEIVNDRIDNPKESGLSDYIGLEHLDTDEIRIKRYGSPDEVEATKFICKKGDIIFGKRRAYLRKLAVTERDAVVSAHSMVLRPKGEKILTRFLPLLMHSSVFWMTAQAISEGSLSPTIKWKTLKSQEFWIPSIAEQKKISEILWAIEDNIEKTENLIAATEKLTKGFLEQLLTKGIGHKKFKKTELGEIPNEWEIIQLNDIFTFKNGINFTAEQKGSAGVLTIDVLNMFSENIYPKLDNLYRVNKEVTNDYILNKGDLLFVRSSVKKEGIGWVVLFDGFSEPVSFCGFIIRARPNQQKVLSEYLVHYLRSNLSREQMFNYCGKGANTNINQESLSKIFVMVPKIEEQQKILKIINTNIKFLTEATLYLNNQKSMKKKFINSFLSGELLIPKEAIT